MTAAANTLRKLLADNPIIEVAWLYGSRATGLDSHDSDYDVAVALVPDQLRLQERQPFLEDLAYHCRQKISAQVSLVDINRVPVPLAYNVINQGVVLFCRSDFRLRAEQQRVWSLWAEYKAEHERNRQAV
ncbi:MAG: nucleotidyltransferase domain-containing protein [Chromatocurvus sp.]